MEKAETPFAVLRFEVTPTTYLEAHRESVRTSPDWARWSAQRRKVERWLLGGAVAGVTLLVATLVWAGVGRPEPNMVAALALAGLCGAGIMYQQWTRSRAARHRYESGGGMDQTLSAYIAGPWTITCTERELVAEMPLQTVRQGWAMFTEVVELPGAVLLRGVNATGFVVPRSAFEPGSAEGFIARVRAVLEDRGASPRERLRAYFAANGAACPSCRYALRGTDGSRCPECGLALGLRDFPGALHEPPGQQPDSKAATKSP